MTSKLSWMNQMPNYADLRKLPQSQWTFDKTIKPGDIILTYYLGYHVVTSVGPSYKDPRDTSIERPGEIHFTQILQEDGSPSPKRRRSCSGYYCTKVDRAKIEEMYQASADAANKLRSALLDKLRE